MKNWDTIKQETLQLMFSYSNRGVILTEAQTSKDYILAMENAANTALRDLAKLFPIVKSIAVELQDGKNVIRLGERASDFMRLADRPIWKDGKCLADFELMPDQQTLLLEGKGGEAEIFYHAYPTEITAETEGEYVFELAAEVVDLLPFYIAATLFLEDDQQIANSYYSKYESKKQEIFSMRQKPRVSVVKL